MSVAKSYANALFEAAREARVAPDQMAQLEKQLADFNDVLNSSNQVRVVLTGPATSPKEKVALVALVTPPSSGPGSCWRSAPAAAWPSRRPSRSSSPPRSRSP